MTELKLPKSPHRVAAKYALVAFVVAVVAGVAINTALGGGSGQSYDRGKALGTGIAPVILVAYAIGYFVQKRRNE